MESSAVSCISSFSKPAYILLRLISVFFFGVHGGTTAGGNSAGTPGRFRQWESTQSCSVYWIMIVLVRVVARLLSVTVLTGNRKFDLIVSYGKRMVLHPQEAKTWDY
jgi:hypothetical protein